VAETTSARRAISATSSRCSPAPGCMSCLADRLAGVRRGRVARRAPRDLDGR
jgi:hypothetical protein